MRFGEISKSSVFLMFLIICIGNNACGQTQQEKVKQAEELEFKAGELYLVGNNEEALKYQLKAIELNPHNPLSYAILSSIYVDLEQPEKAVEAVEKAVSMQSNNSKIQYQAGIAYRRIENKKKVFEHFFKAVELSPRDTNYLINLGGAYEDLNDKKSARKVYKKAIEIDPEYVPALNLLGQLEIDEGNKEKGIKLLKRALEIEIPAEKQGEQLSSQRSARERLKEIEDSKPNETN